MKLRLKTQATIVSYGAMLVVMIAAWDLPAKSFVAAMLAIVVLHAASWLGGTEEQSSKTKGTR